jgi:hypothetical protein
MKKIHEEALNNINSIVEDMVSSLMEASEEVPTINNFFEFLANNPRAYTFAYAYYVYPAKTNKYMNGMPRTDEYLNPYHGKILKSALIEFKWGETFIDAMKRINPDYEPSRDSHYKQHPDFNVVKLNSKGEKVVPIVPKPYSGDYAILEDDGSIKKVAKEEIQEYLAPASPSRGEQWMIPMRYDRIFQLSAGRMKWRNPDVIYPYFGPKAPSE